MKLQDIELGTNKRYCATFTSTQYEVIYISKLQEGKRLLKSLCDKSTKWQCKMNFMRQFVLVVCRTDIHSFMWTNVASVVFVGII